MPYKITGDLHCWEWTGYTIKGTPTIRTPDGQTTARRRYWEREHPPIPEGERLEAICGNVLCVRPLHHRLVDTATMNRRTGRTRLTPQLRKTAVKLVAEGHSYRQAAKLLGVSGRTIGRALK